MRPPSRRRRVGAPSDPQPEPNSLCGSSDQNRTDLISHLPDCVLSSIISLLPIRDSIRTSILSSRFRHLWKLNPLHLDDSTIKSDQLDAYETSQAVSRIASVHPGPIHSFRVSQFDLEFRREVDDLVETLTGKGIRELSLGFGYQGRLRYRLPSSVLQCPTLRKVSLSDCFIPPSPVVNSSFPNLRELTLEFVFLWDDLLHCILKSCAQLEVLQLMNCSGLQYVRLSCAKLQKLTIHEEGYGSHAKEVVIENAPELRSLRFGESTVDCIRFSVQHVQKLEVLGFFSMNANMRFGNTFSKSYNQYEMSVNRSMGLPTVKRLAILVGFADGFKRSLLSSVLRCFPCLETLDIKCIKSIGPAPDIGFWEQQAPFGFFEQHLKSVTMVNFSGMRTEVEFVKFFVQHGRVLKRITLIYKHKPSATWQKTKRRELRLKNRASMYLEVVFVHKSDFDPDSCAWAPLFHRPLPGA
ncbi:F-box/RNI-like/FBD-like domains-containing protein [Rhynchospora pubera]|nr:F-box/RNI-like/FBD-like domains-containing protein [Rhynchospora pubera]